MSPVLASPWLDSGRDTGARSASEIVSMKFSKMRPLVAAGYEGSRDDSGVAPRGRRAGTGLWKPPITAHLCRDISRNSYSIDFGGAAPGDGDSAGSSEVLSRTRRMSRSMPVRQFAPEAAATSAVGTSAVSARAELVPKVEAVGRATLETPDLRARRSTRRW